MAEQELSIVIRARNDAKAALKDLDVQFRGMGTSIQNVTIAANNAQASIDQIGQANASLTRIADDLDVIAGKMKETETSSGDVNLSLVNVTDSFKALSENTASYAKTTQEANSTTQESTGFFLSLGKYLAGLVGTYIVVKTAVSDATTQVLEEVEAHKREQEQIEATTKSIATLGEAYKVTAHSIAVALMDASQGALTLDDALYLVSKDMGDGIPQAISIEKAYARFADRIHVLVEDLSEADKRFAVDEAVKQKAIDINKAYGDSILSIEEKFDRFFISTQKEEETLTKLDTIITTVKGDILILGDSMSGAGKLIASGWMGIAGQTDNAQLAMDSAKKNGQSILSTLQEMMGLESEHAKLEKEQLERTSAQNKADRERNEYLLARSYQIEAEIYQEKQLAEAAEKTAKQENEAFSILGVVSMVKEIEKLEEAYQTLESSGLASTSELNQAHDNMLEKIKKLKGEGIDPLVEVYKTLGFQSSKEVEEGLDKMRAAYETLRDSGVASAGDIAQAWQAVETKQKEVADKADVYAAILKDKIVPAATAYASALAESGKAEVAALRNGLDARFTQIADAAKNAGKSIEGINSAMANKFDTARKATDDLAKAMSDLRSATNAYANDLDRVGNEQYLQYQKLIQSLRDYGASAEQIRQAEIAANKNYKSLVEARIDAERVGLTELIKIRDQNLNNYKQHKEDIKQIDQAIANAWLYAEGVRTAVEEKGFTTEEKNISELDRLYTQLANSEWLGGDARLQLLRQIEQKAGQIAISSQANSEIEAYAIGLVNEASGREIALLIQIKRQHEDAAKSAETLAKNTDLAIAKSQELISGLQAVVRALGQTIADSDLAVKIKLLDEAMEPAKKLKDELKKLFGDDIIQKIRIVKTQPDGNNTSNSTNTDNSTDSNTVDDQFGEPSIPGFATGISYVPRDMVARIHQGETILNKQDADRYRSGQGNVSFGDIHINVPPGVPITRAVVMEIRRELARIDRRVSS